MEKRHLALWRERGKDGQQLCRQGLHDHSWGLGQPAERHRTRHK
jgi:hypothetical protein